MCDCLKYRGWTITKDFNASRLFDAIFEISKNGVTIIVYSHPIDGSFVIVEKTEYSEMYYSVKKISHALRTVLILVKSIEHRLVLCEEHN